MSIVSYAQNFEDVMLWRALRDVANGFYVDIGAQHPVVDSVSKAFHEHGWHGIHIEPSSTYADLLRKDRPADTVIQAAVSDESRILRFYEFPDTGLSTLDPEIAVRHQTQGFVVRESDTPCVMLDDILGMCTERDVHWLKIDVEGHEENVLRGWRQCAVRPWIVVVESTLPTTQTQSYKSWEPLLLEKGYRFAWFDGLNRFYLAETHCDLLERFTSPPNVFDGFVMKGTASAPFGRHLLERIDQQLKAHTEELARSSLQHANALAHVHALIEEKELELAQLTQEHAARLDALTDEKLQVRLRYQNKLDSLDAIHAEYKNRHVQLERDLRQQVVEETHGRLNAESARNHEQAELLKRLSDEQATRSGSEDEYNRRHAELLQQLQSTYQHLHQREAEFSAAQKLSREHFDELTQKLDLREIELARDLETARRQLVNQQKEQIIRESLLNEEFARARTEVEAQLRHQGEREAELARQLTMLASAKTERETEFAKLIDAQHRRNQALSGRNDDLVRKKHELLQQVASGQRLLSTLDARHRLIEHEYSAEQQRWSVEYERGQSTIKEFELHEQELEEAIARGQAEFECIRQAYTQLEHEYAAEQQRWSVEYEKGQSTIKEFELHEKELEKAIARGQAEFECIRQAYTQLEHGHSAEQQRWSMEYERSQSTIKEFELHKQELELAIAQRHAEFERLKQAHAQLELELASTRSAAHEEKATLDNSLYIAHQQLHGMRRSLSWRITAPLRAVAASFMKGRAAATPEDALFVPYAGASSRHGALSDAPAPPLQCTGPISYSTESEMSPSQPIQCLVPQRDGAYQLDDLTALDDQAFVEQAYLVLLNREPDPEGLRYYLGRLRQGYSKIGILTQLSTSAEGQQGTGNLLGLSSAARIFRLARMPMLGRLLGSLLDIETDKCGQRRLRRIENRIAQVGHDAQRRFARIDGTLTSIVQQAQQSTAQIDSKMASLSTQIGRLAYVARPDLLSPRSSEQVGTVELADTAESRRLSSMARDLFNKLASDTRTV